MNRSARSEIRNPVPALASAQRVAELPPSARAALRAVLVDLSDDAAERAERSWRTRKAPMAAYWKAVSVYARHIARAVR